MVPAYCRSRAGGVYRVIRASEALDASRVRYTLRAVPIFEDGHEVVEVTRELDSGIFLDKLRHGQAIPTPERTFEELWQQLRINLDLGCD